MKIKLEFIDMLEENVFEGSNYGTIAPVDYNDSVIEYVKSNDIKLYLIADGYYEFEESEDYKVIQAVDYNGDLNIGYSSVHLILLNKNTLETKDYYISISDSSDF